MAEWIVLTACSDARTDEDRKEIEELENILKDSGESVSVSRYLYDGTASGKDKAEELNLLFADNVKAILDVSGGNAANEVLPYLNYEAIADSSTVFFGYSDLTTIINAIYAKTGKASVLYQARHIVGNGQRRRELCEFMKKLEEKQLNALIPDMNQNEKSVEGFTTIDYHFIQGSEINGTILGGNLRCFLKLAGTEYMPDMTDKVLLMEALGGDIYSVRSMLSQLTQLGVFDAVRGIVVGTFSALSKEGKYDEFLKLLLKHVPYDMPVAVTDDIGHGRDAKAVRIG